MSKLYPYSSVDALSVGRPLERSEAIRFLIDAVTASWRIPRPRRGAICGDGKVCYIDTKPRGPQFAGRMTEVRT